MSRIVHSVYNLRVLLSKDILYFCHFPFSQSLDTDLQLDKILSLCQNLAESLKSGRNAETDQFFMTEVL